MRVTLLLLCVLAVACSGSDEQAQKVKDLEKQLAECRAEVTKIDKELSECRADAPKSPGNRYPVLRPRKGDKPPYGKPKDPGF